VEWDEKYSGIQTRENLELPADVSATELDLSATFSPRQIIK
jgi:hypothetical protein